MEQKFFSAIMTNSCNSVHCYLNIWKETLLEKSECMKHPLLYTIFLIVIIISWIQMNPIFESPVAAEARNIPKPQKEYDTLVLS